MENKVCLFYRMYCRIFQAVMKGVAASVTFLWREPALLIGEESISQLALAIKEKGLKKILIVTDEFLHKNGFLSDLERIFEAAGIDFVVFSLVSPNPTFEMVEDARKVFVDNGCDGLVAFGGGSPTDCAKAAGARIAKPKKSLPKMKGLLKVLKKIPPLFAIPTTAGSGSEATLAAVITDEKTHDKFAIMDHVLIPKIAVLDPKLTAKMPPFLTATTGIDALTHAVESYVGGGNTRKTKKWSEKAVVLIYENLLTAFNNPSDLKARENMQLAAFMAGKSFHRAYVGYVHAIAHALSGHYDTAHGLANSVVMPYVLKAYGKSAHKKLARLARLINLQGCDSVESAASAFISYLEELNAAMQIPKTIDGIKKEDIKILARQAAAEANPLYPVPKILSPQSLEKLIEKIGGYE
jgi:alcohol dehydrogenase class IV